MNSRLKRAFGIAWRVVLMLALVAILLPCGVYFIGFFLAGGMFPIIGIVGVFLTGSLILFDLYLMRLLVQKFRSFLKEAKKE